MKQKRHKPEEIILMGRGSVTISLQTPGDKVETVSSD